MIKVTQLDGFGTKTTVQLSKATIVYITQNIDNEKLDSVIYCDNGKSIWVDESFDVLKRELSEFCECEDLSPKKFDDSEQSLLCIVNAKMIEATTPCESGSFAKYVIELKTNKKLFTNNTIA